MITVIVPVYNGGAYFRRCIQSLARQDAPPGSFDVVILDNCSTDGCIDALRELPDKTPRRVLRSTQLLPIEENWRRILSLTDVKPFITIMGHDDELDPEFIRLSGDAIAGNDELCLLFSHFRLIDAEGSVIRPCRPMAAVETAGDFLAGRLAEVRDSFGTGYVIRFDEYKRAGGLPPFEKLLFADDALWLSLARRAPIQILKQQTFSYRLHSSSASNSKESATFLHALSAYTAFLEENMLDDLGVRRALEMYGMEFIRRTAGVWMLQEIVSASAAGTLARPDVTQGWRQLAARFAAMTGETAEPPVDSPEYRFNGWVNANVISRRLSRHQLGLRLLRRVYVATQRARH